MSVKLIFDKEFVSERHRGLLREIGFSETVELRATFADDPNAAPLQILYCKEKIAGKLTPRLSIRTVDIVGPRKITEDEIGEVMDYVGWDRKRITYYHDRHLNCHIFPLDESKLTD